jgi:deoxyribose-phosphate aldolase
MERHLSKAAFAKKIDHTALKAETTEKNIISLAKEAAAFGFYSVCINPDRIPLAKSVLQDENAPGIKVVTVVGFPLGANDSSIKALEAEKAVRNGASEIDMVANIGSLFDKDYKHVKKDINDVLQTIPPHVLLKVIIETAALPHELKKDAAKIVADTDAAFVKTSTGFHPSGGATVEDVALLHAVVGQRKQIKAAGGMADLDSAVAMLNAGADRLGMSRSVTIMNDVPPEGILISPFL